MSTELTDVSAIDKKDKAYINKGKVLNYYFDRNMKQADICRALNLSKQYVSDILKPFKDIRLDDQVLESFNKNRTKIYDSIELLLSSEMTDRERIKKASLNNVAYTAQVMNNINRLEKDLSTSNIKQAMQFQVINSEQERNDFIDDND
jgi:DNA-binding transcriptional regulator GbsR (MarR family)